MPSRQHRVGEPLGQRGSELHRGIAAIGQHVAGMRHHRVEVDAVERAAGSRVRVQLLREHWLSERSQHEAVVGGDDMHRAALHDEPDDRSFDQQGRAPSRSR